MRQKKMKSNRKFAQGRGARKPGKENLERKEDPNKIPDKTDMPA